MSSAEFETAARAAVANPRPGLARRALVAAAALEAGHLPDVQKHGKRFVIVCDCGWKTDPRWTKKHAIQAATDHAIRAGRTALGETPAAGRVERVTRPGESGVSVPRDEAS